MVLSPHSLTAQNTVEIALIHNMLSLWKYTLSASNRATTEDELFFSPNIVACVFISVLIQGGEVKN